MTRLTKTFDAVGKSAAVLIEKGDTLKVSLGVADGETFAGTIVLENSLNGGASFDAVQSFDAPAYVEIYPAEGLYRLNCTVFDPEEESTDDMVCVLLEHKADYATTGGDGFEILITNADAAVTVSTDVYQSQIVTSASQLADEVEIGDGTGVTIGTRKLITLVALTDAGDSIALDYANFSQGADTITAIELAAVDDFVLAEWQGASWEIISATAGVVSVA